MNERVAHRGPCPKMAMFVIHAWQEPLVAATHNRCRHRYGLFTTARNACCAVQDCAGVVKDNGIVCQLGGGERKYVHFELRRAYPGVDNSEARRNARGPADPHQRPQSERDHVRGSSTPSAAPRMSPRHRDPMLTAEPWRVLKHSKSPARPIAHQGKAKGIAAPPHPHAWPDAVTNREARRYAVRSRPGG